MKKKLIKGIVLIFTVAILCITMGIFSLATDEMEMYYYFGNETGDGYTLTSNIKWSVSDDGVLTFSGSGRMMDLPESAPYSWIYEAQNKGTSISEVIIEEGITYIGDYVLNGMGGKLSIPSSVTELGAGVFMLSSYEQITIPESVKVIPQNTFMLSSSGDIIIEGDININSSAFTLSSANNLIINGDLEAEDGCFLMSSFVRATINGEIKKVGEGAFAITSGFEELRLSDEIGELGEGSFAMCSDLKRIIASKENPYYYTDENGVLFNKDKTSLICLPSAFEKESYSVIDGVSCIEVCAFTGSKNLKNIYLSNSVTEIKEGAFENCFRLEEIVIPSSNLSIGNMAFANCLSLDKIKIMNKNITFGDEVFIVAYGPKEGVDFNEWLEIAIEANSNPMLALFGDSGIYKKYIEMTDNYEEPYKTNPYLTIYGYTGSTVEAYANANAIEFKAFETAEDLTTGITVVYDNDSFDTTTEMKVTENGENANFVFGSEFTLFKSYDINFIDGNGEKVQPKGYVTVKLPLPVGYNAETTKIYYVAPDGSKTLLNSWIEDTYIVFETDHFSEYVIVDESSKIEPPHEHSYTASITKEATCTENGTTTYTCSCGDSYTETIEATGHDFDGNNAKCTKCEFDRTSGCSCNCHKKGIGNFFFKLILFFQKLFKANKICKCGIAHY